MANLNLPSQTIWDFTFIGNKIIACANSGLWYTSLNLTTINETNNFHQDFNIYPNPSNNYFIIEGISQGKSFFTLYNSLGKQILEMTLNENTETSQVNTSSFSEGLYVWKITNDKGFVRSGRIAVVR